MNTKMMIIAAAATLGLAAQTAKIPFAFEANGKKMAAGAYTLQVSGPKTFIAIRHADTGNSLFVTNAGGNGNRLAGSQLVFNVYGDRYFLKAIADPKSGAVTRIPQSRSEKEIARVMPAETVVRNAE